MSSPEDEMNSILSHYDYSMLPMPSASSDSLLTQSQYAKVIFHDLLPVYPTDADIWCRYTVTEGVCVRHGDRVALYRVGWMSVHDHVQFEMAPVPSDGQAKDKRREDSEFQVLFRASSLPKDTSEFYQLCYVNVDSCVCGASVPFQFRRPTDDELCEVEEQEGLLVVRSRTAINEDKLRDATHLIEELEKRNLDHERRIADLTTIKDKLGRRLDELAHIERHEMRLQEDIQVLDSEKTELSLKLGTSEHRLDKLQAMVDTLSAEKTSLSALLRAECCREKHETERMASQLDNMQQMLDACTQSKEMAAQALHCEQSKVMRLNIEHDKYKFRSGCLEEENAALKAEVTLWQQDAGELKTQVEKNLELLAAKTQSCEALTKMMKGCTAEKALLEKELRAAIEQCQSKAAKMIEQDDQIVRLIHTLKRAENDVRATKEEVDSLRQSVVSVMSEHRPPTGYDDREVEQLREENASLKQRQAQQDTELELAKKMIEELKMRRKPLERSRYPEPYPRERLVNRQQEKVAMTVSQDECVLQQSSGRASEGDAAGTTQVSLLTLKALMTTAEQHNAILQAELGRIESRKTNDSGPSITTVQGELARMAKKANRTSNARANITIKQSEPACVAKTSSGSGDTQVISETARLMRSKADMELQVAQCTTRQQESRHRLNQIARRLVEIEGESKGVSEEVDALAALNQAEINDLHYLNHRMETLQQQVLREDEFQGMERESEEVNRLERMSKRAHDLETYVARSSAQLEYARQMVQVLAAEEEGLQGDADALEKSLREESTGKIKLVEKLEEIERQLATEMEIDRRCEIEQKSDEEVAWDLAFERSVDEKKRVKKSSLEAVQLNERESPITFIEGENDNEDFSLMMDASMRKPEQERSDGGDHASVDCVSGNGDSMVSDIGNGDPMLSDVGQGDLTDTDYIPHGIEKFVTQKLLQSLPEPRGSGEAELQLRLDLAAAEYRKVYMEKLKAERKLKKMKNKCSTGSCSSETSIESTPAPREFVCPICAATFPLNEPEPFTRHFEDHLS